MLERYEYIPDCFRTAADEKERKEVFESEWFKRKKKWASDHPLFMHVVEEESEGPNNAT